MHGTGIDVICDRYEELRKWNAILRCVSNQSYVDSRRMNIVEQHFLQSGSAEPLDESVPISHNSGSNSNGAGRKEVVIMVYRSQDDQCLDPHQDNAFDTFCSRGGIPPDGAAVSRSRVCRIPMPLLQQLCGQGREPVAPVKGFNGFTPYLI